jgi:hypothetical protein
MYSMRVSSALRSVRGEDAFAVDLGVACLNAGFVLLGRSAHFGRWF